MRAHEFITENEMVWKRHPRTGALTLWWRCKTGFRKGRTVPTPSDCGQSYDAAQAARMKSTRARTKVRQARRTKRTKKINPTSKLVSMLNRFKRKR